MELQAEHFIYSKVDLYRIKLIAKYPDVSPITLKSPKGNAFKEIPALVTILNSKILLNL